MVELNLNQPSNVKSPEKTKSVESTDPNFKKSPVPSSNELDDPNLYCAVSTCALPLAVTVLAVLVENGIRPLSSSKNVEASVPLQCNNNTVLLSLTNAAVGAVKFEV